jgi:hypothetical protein
MNARLYLQTLFGNPDSPFTEKDFTSEELLEIEALIQRDIEYEKEDKARGLKVREGELRYEEYPFPDVRGPIGTALGRFAYTTDPKTGERVITDTYDFYNPDRKERVEEYAAMAPIEKASQTALRSIVSFLQGKEYGYEQGSEGGDARSPWVNMSPLPRPALPAAEIGMAYIGKEGRPLEVRYQPEGKADGGGITAVRRIQKFQLGGGADQSLYPQDRARAAASSVAPSGQNNNLLRTEILKNELARRGIPPVNYTFEQVRDLGFEDVDAFREARLASLDMMGVEMGIGLRGQMGPYRSGAIDPSRYSMIAAPASVSGTRGLYARPNVSASEEQLIAFDEPYREVLDQENMKHFGQDMVYTFGAPQANLKILGHEFGHRGDYMQGLYPPTGAREAIMTHLSSVPPSEQYEETFNLFFDAWRARTPEQWEDAVGTWGYTQNRFFQETGGEQGRDYSAGSSGWTQAMVNRASADLIRLLDLNRENLLALEVNSLDKIQERLYANLEKRGLPYTRPTSEELAEFRAEDFINQGDQADTRARMTGRAPTPREPPKAPPVERAYGGGVYG